MSEDGTTHLGNLVIDTEGDSAGSEYYSVVCCQSEAIGLANPARENLDKCSRTRTGSPTHGNKVLLAAAEVKKQKLRVEKKQMFGKRLTMLCDETQQRATELSSEADNWTLSSSHVHRKLWC